MSNLLTRLQVIQAAIDLGDEDVVALQAQRLPPEAAALAQCLMQQQYTEATLWIKEYRQNNTMLDDYIDPEVSALQLELASLENLLILRTTKKAEYDRQINEFNAAYMHRLGPILEKLLQQDIRQQEEQLTSQPDADEEALQQARDAYEKFHRQQQQQAPITHLSDDEKAELKQSYKQAAARCHPDRLPDDQEEQGTQKFKELTEAYHQQDLPRVRKILAELKDGDWTLGSAAISNKAILRRRIGDMRSTIAALEAAIEAILEDETWVLITSLAADSDAWDDYFSRLQTELEKKLVNE